MADSAVHTLPRVDTVQDLRETLDGWRREGCTLGFVPTMGALHEGHLSLVRRAAREADRVVASVFVNPTQFGPGEDLDAYPRDPEGDAAKLAGAGCHLLFLPAVDTIYPPGHSSFVEVEGPSRGFEGAERPGHFRGVATVVSQLFHIVEPDVAIFGQKDAQQLALVRRMVHDLHFRVRIVGAPIVREKDGLALSSRNVYLSPEERRAATVLHRSLEAAREQIEAGERDAAAIRRAIHDQLATEPLGVVDYVGTVHALSFEPLDELRGECVIPLAVRFGKTRLLDNLHLHLDDG
jgi:pantoate--beta-alanine ligase